MAGRVVLVSVEEGILCVLRVIGKSLRDIRRCGEQVLMWRRCAAGGEFIKIKQNEMGGNKMRQCGNRVVGDKLLHYLWWMLYYK